MHSDESEQVEAEYEDKAFPVEVHLVTCLVIDFDDLGDIGVISEMENVRYPNRCMSPIVLSIKTEEVQWTEDHPLNTTDKQQEAVYALFTRCEACKRRAEHQAEIDRYNKSGEADSRK